MDHLTQSPKDSQSIKSLLSNFSIYFFETSSNTLPLGLKGIKARNLIQSLIFDDISLINGQECLFGFAKPSFVLQLMGYSENQSRELLSLSFKEKVDINRLAQKIIQKYRQIKSLQG